MRALLICPAERPAVEMLYETVPLVLVPMLGKTLVEYWMEYLSSRNCAEVVMLASDRPEQVRAYVAGGERWGIKVEVWPATGEAGALELALDPCNGTEAEWIEVMDCLPLICDQPLFVGYNAWFAALETLMSQSLAGARLGIREIEPGIWTSAHVDISSAAKLIPPCWIGRDVKIGEGAVVGPLAIIENCVCIEKDAEITRSVILSGTLVGEGTEIKNSIAWSSNLVHLPAGETLRVTDRFLLSALEEQPAEPTATSFGGRIMAALLMIPIMPFACMAMASSVIKGQAYLRVKTAVKPCLIGSDRRGQTCEYFEVPSRYGWIRRWPQLWEAVCGRFAFIGNRPLSPQQAGELRHDFEKLWLSVPTGVISLADTDGSISPFGEGARAHACYYVVKADRWLDYSIFFRVVILRPFIGLKSAVKDLVPLPARYPELGGQG